MDKIVEPHAQGDIMSKNGAAMFSDHEVRVRAHQIWERKGRPEGQVEENWREALAELEAEAALTGVGADYLPKSVGLSASTESHDEAA